MHRSNLLRRLNRPGESNADYEKLLETGFPSPRQCNDPAWNFVAGSVTNRDPDRAVLLAEKAVRLAPTNSAYVNTLGVAYYRMEQFEKAAETLLESGRLNAEGLQAFDLFFLAMSYQKLGDPNKAMDYYQQAVQWVEKSSAQLSAEWNNELHSFPAEAKLLLGIPKVQ
jgi:tetratricopeptide (TPR) repeat protein